VTPERARVLAELADMIVESHATRVAVDGRSAAGKSTLARELAQLLEARSRPVVRMTSDDFHRPETERYARGRDSAEGFYRDSFDTSAISARALEPVDGVLLCDGVFLLVPELADVWELAIWLEIDERVSLERGVARDASWMGGEEEARRRYEARYVAGERMYIEEVDPRALADLVVVNDDPDSPRLDREPI
jgi:uridine kinase